MDDLSNRLSVALSRIDDFRAVQHGADRDELAAAVLRLQEAVGIDGESRQVLCEGIDRLHFEQQAVGVLFGLVLGLLVAQDAA